jgi:hypothetical protein
LPAFYAAAVKCSAHLVLEVITPDWCYNFSTELSISANQILPRKNTIYHGGCHGSCPRLNGALRAGRA